MFMHEYLIQCEWELAREIERQEQLDPERAWLRLEHTQTNLDPIVKSVARGIQTLVDWIRRVQPVQPGLVDQGQVPGTALQPLAD